MPVMRRFCNLPHAIWYSISVTGVDSVKNQRGG